jgi:hypothetical protein
MLQSTAHSHRRIIVIHALLNKRLHALCLLVVFFLSCTTSSAPKDDALSVQGVVVAIQRGEKDARLIEPESFADLAEIYMVRADRWSPSVRKEKYIIVEYVHHKGLIEYEQFNKTHWILELHQQSAEVNQDCLSWITRGAAEELKFVATAFGAKTKLPDPETLPCFLITKRPSVAR